MMQSRGRKAGYVSQPAAADPRSTEAWALSEVSRRLVIAAKNKDAGTSLREALNLTQRLWTIFQASITEEDCPLPLEIRNNVLALSIMVDRQILLRLGDLDGSKLQPILDINRCVAEGLAQNPQPNATAGLSEMARGVQYPGMQPAVAAGAGPAAPQARVVVNVSA
jgi:flagellar protein FlaF